MKDIFISYRRQDGETAAYLIYRDLLSDGYSVFFDHKTLGGGDFRKGILDSISDCNDVIVILTASSFSEKIFSQEDVYRFEIETSILLKKRIVGIMMEGFSGFPEKLPDSIDIIRNMNCLKLYMGYYDAMYSRLTSGAFLSSLPKGSDISTPSNVAIESSIPEELKPLSNLQASDRNASIQLLLKLMDSFNNSEICMRFYRYIDLYDRNLGVEDILPYEGIIPTDLVTYLSFFETLYIIVASGSLDISVIDYAYRFRFFAGCNNPTMQESELLPLGYQYPNIMSFYNLWINHIVDHYDHNSKVDNISSKIPMYEYDLHKRYASFCFANNPNTPVKIRFLDRKLIWLNLILKTMNPDEIELCMSLQKKVLDKIERNDEINFFEALTIDEMKRTLNQGGCIGLYKDEVLIAQMNIILEPEEQENLTLDLTGDYNGSNAAVLDYVVVEDCSRGYAIQKTLIFVAECIARNQKKEGVIAVTSPYNTYSIKSFISQGYKIVATLPKYKSMRHYLWKSL